MPSKPRALKRADYATMAMVSCAVLLYEIAITRVLSVVLWYHFAFLAISLAMLGLGAPGVWFALRRVRWGNSRPLLVGAGIAVPASIILIVNWVARLGLGPETPASKVALTAVITLVPLVLLGSVVCLLLLRAEGRLIGRMYAADLLGATVGATLVVLLLTWIPTPHLIGAIGLLPLAALLLDRRSGAWRLPIGLVATILISLFWGTPYELHFNKNYAEDRYNLLYDRWTPTARLTVFPGNIFNADPRNAFGWGFGDRYPGQQLSQYWIDQDGSAGTPMTELTGPPAELEHLDYDVTSTGYQLRPPQSVCIIGAGGGRDILTALKAGATLVDAVELNAAMIETVSEVFAEFSGDPYHLPGVHAYAREGRSFLTHTDRHYDLIQVSLIDSWAATTAGAYALSENYLYTVESIRLLWERLTPTGLASVSRWSGGVESQLESVRLALLVEEALTLEGVAAPRNHFVVVQGGVVATLLFSKQAFGPGDIERLDRINEERGFLRLWPLDDPATLLTDPRAPWVSRALVQGVDALTENGLFLDPPTDDRPFFFQNVRPFTSLNPLLQSVLSFNDRAARLPRFLILTVGSLTLVLFFAPFALARRLQRGPGFWRGSAYFIAIGLGFMLVEAPLIQKFILYLGHPSYATTVVLSGLLLGSGLGSLAAGKVELARISRVRWLLPLAIAIVNVVLSPIFEATLGAPFARRIMVSLAIVVPLGGCLGFAFPTGMIAFGERNKAWLWALNGAASVLATTAALAIAPYTGLTGVVWAGVLCYLGATLALPRVRAVTRTAAAATP